jgi:hypothetical protein
MSPVSREDWEDIDEDIEVESLQNILNTGGGNTGGSNTGGPPGAIPQASVGSSTGLPGGSGAMDVDASSTANYPSSPLFGALQGQHLLVPDSQPTSFASSSPQQPKRDEESQ